MTETLPPLREVIRRHNLGARRSLGQHFLLDLNLCSRIARASGDLSQSNVIEIGPGPGGLTRALLEAGAAVVTAIELDERCVAALEELVPVYPKRLRVVKGDALGMDIPALVSAPRRIVANLPYNIATPLLIRWLKQIADFEKLTCMFQREVADRLAAHPRTKDYGRLSVMTQWLCEVRHEFNVSREAFTPPPKVASSVVTLTPRPRPLAPAGWDAMETVTKAAFGQRRKMLRSSIKALNLDMESLGINPAARAEELDIEQFCVLARALEASRQ
ncbi:MAG: 16S rRNA (adenine(1518)-N(6)/adenine(1519)-N(6))-dimethyltransferase [Rhodospirillales bacterium RIFCSPLOWO2_12_FULL_58_28]|nr:MAG: 16S rRNA (adenine(1518)-N(6)/adenine(1519)-N(6))-dimethyltransferase [Rhodospirillales bacterium RIFCSPLOWO2_02_FULL_58_16]OHC77188.1 MAG: 16S rRNA (adenine(1518)-N(6)/adenine(1519)-N(6))-dimethyltransferase [Rhodospirillales bacterium RIFCSPLOWO2_12_FULL_58_28]